MDSKKVDVATINKHFNAAQLRTDTWNRLVLASKKLAKPQDDEERAGRIREVGSLLNILSPIERFWDFPGKILFRRLFNQFENGDYPQLAFEAAYIGRLLASDGYRRRRQESIVRELQGKSQGGEADAAWDEQEQHYFALLVVDDLTENEEMLLRETLHGLRQPGDKFLYEPVVVPSFEDALIAVLFNTNIQACLLRYGFKIRSSTPLQALRHYMRGKDENWSGEGVDRETALCQAIHELRPELDQYLITEIAPEKVSMEASRIFRRIFYNERNYMDVHLSILRGIWKRFKTPFFTALKEYSRQPTGVFHALPISRGNSIYKSHWIQDMGQFYGSNIFLAETSATQGGLDSLLQPMGPLREAQEAAARAFGSQHTFFVTNGTSTANKIVVQALVRPGDTVLVDRDCHKSHHYGLVLSGANAMYLDAYEIKRYSMYGAVPLREIKAKLLSLKQAGRLHEAKMVLLTNCTFDGLVYNVRRYMEEILAIKPDMMFLWDEAWFAFARCTPTYRQRTAMHCARALQARYADPAYREEYNAWKKGFDKLDPSRESTWMEQPLLPDPDRVKIRVYATHSTHKSLSCLRQGSMIHVYDEEFNRQAEAPFMEAYMTHTSTSPNYQILASLDVARRQVELEGFELVQESIEHAMTLRQEIRNHPLLNKYFQAPGPSELIPEQHRQSGVVSGYDPDTGWDTVDRAWHEDDFVLDPTRVTLDITATGIEGHVFREKYLMEQHGIQVNKTTFNTVLFLTNIGTNRSAVTFLIKALINISERLEQEKSAFNPAEKTLHDQSVSRLTTGLPALPHFSRFHRAFRPHVDTAEGCIRKAYFLAYDQTKYEYVMADREVDETMESGRVLVSAAFVIPYPPGFPILVPGQIISSAILEFLRVLGDTEIHGYRSDLGLQIFTEAALKELAAGYEDRETTKKPKRTSHAARKTTHKKPRATR
jgi:arginine decarboxylase